MIAVKGISKSYGRNQALNNVSFSLENGTALVILGHSGCGKTTLLRIIAGLEGIDSGEVYINGQLASQPGWLMPPYRRGFGFVFQNPALWPHMTVFENVGFGISDLPRDEAKSRVNGLLEEMGIRDLSGRYPDQISGGEARRVALARALAPKPGFVLMDEPLTNLDYDTKEKILALIKSEIVHSQSGLIYVTHDNDEAGQISDNSLTMRGGRIVQ
jgi:iron(III) transport system ATP-binding protein